MSKWASAACWKVQFCFCFLFFLFFFCRVGVGAHRETWLVDACAGLKRETRNNWIYSPCMRACMYSGSMNTSELQAVSMILPLHFSCTRLLNELLLWRGKWLHSNNSSGGAINLKKNHSLKCLHPQVDHTHGCVIPFKFYQACFSYSSLWLELARHILPHTVSTVILTLLHTFLSQSWARIISGESMNFPPMLQNNNYDNHCIPLIISVTCLRFVLTSVSRGRSWTQPDTDTDKWFVGVSFCCCSDSE